MQEKFFLTVTVPAGSTFVLHCSSNFKRAQKVYIHNHRAIYNILVADVEEQLAIRNATLILIA